MTSDDQHSLTLSAETDNALTLMQFFLKSVDLSGDLTGATITLESDSSFTLSPEMEYGLEVDQSDPAEVEPDEDEAETEDTDRTEAEEAAEPQPMSRDKIIAFRDDSNPLAIMEMFYERRDEGYFNVSKVRQFTPNDAGIQDSSFSAILWDLAERGLIEKKDSESRGNEYKITGKGIASVEAHHESEAETPPAPAASSD